MRQFLCQPRRFCVITGIGIEKLAVFTPAVEIGLLCAEQSGPPRYLCGATKSVAIFGCGSRTLCGRQDLIRLTQSNPR